MPIPFDQHDWTLSRRALLGLGAASLLSPLSQVHAQTSVPTLVRVSWRAKESLQEADGRILQEAVDGGLVLQEQDGRIHLIDAKELVSRKDLAGTRFEPITPNELAIQLKKQFGAGFGTVITDTHVICSNTTRVYAEWVGDMFSRLRKGFDKFWSRDKLNFHEPEFPLPVIAFAERKQYAEYALKDADASTAVALGYYSLRTNRVALFDLTSLAKSTKVLRSISDVSDMMNLYQGNVTNVVHEAVHQLSFNCGLHQRFADNPLWLVEGLAIFSEIPDLKSRRNWLTVGDANWPRIARLSKYYKSGARPDDSLVSLVREDSRFSIAETALDAYSEAWGLNYYLIEKHRKEYVSYLQHLAAKKPLVFLSPDERQQEFEQFFGTDWKELDEEMIFELRRIRR